MTIIEAITRADEIARNAYSQKIKVQWVSEVEALCHREMVFTRAGSTDDWKPFPEDVDLNTKLVMPEPYDSAYVYYLESKIHYANEEFDLYNAAAAKFGEMYGGWKSWLNTQKRHQGYRRFLF